MLDDCFSKTGTHQLSVAQIIFKMISVGYYYYVNYNCIINN